MPDGAGVVQVGSVGFGRGSLAILGTAHGRRAAGALPPRAFQASDAAVARTDAVRSIFDRDDDRNLFDADGAGRKRAVLLATVQTGAAVVASHFQFSCCQDFGMDDTPTCAGRNRRSCNKNPTVMT